MWIVEAETQATHQQAVGDTPYLPPQLPSQPPPQPPPPSTEPAVERTLLTVSSATWTEIESMSTDSPIITTSTTSTTRQNAFNLTSPPLRVEPTAEILASVTSPTSCSTRHSPGGSGFCKPGHTTRSHWAAGYLRGSAQRPSVSAFATSTLRACGWPSAGPTLGGPPVGGVAAPCGPGLDLIADFAMLVDNVEAFPDVIFTVREGDDEEDISGLSMEGSRVGVSSGGGGGEGGGVGEPPSESLIAGPPPMMPPHQPQRVSVVAHRAIVAVRAPALAALLARSPTGVPVALAGVTRATLRSLLFFIYTDVLPSALTPAAAVVLSATADQWLLSRCVALCDRLVARSLGGGGGGADEAAPLALAVYLLEIATEIRAPLRPRLVSHVAMRFDDAVRLNSFARLTRETIVELIGARGDE
jgi:hypothetical protein